MRSVSIVGGVWFEIFLYWIFIKLCKSCTSSLSAYFYC